MRNTYFNSTIKCTEDIFRGLTRFYIYIKYIPLYRFVYNDFNVHQYTLSVSNQIRYKF